MNKEKKKKVRRMDGLGNLLTLLSDDILDTH
jgi:hypothetical protein